APRTEPLTPPRRARRSVIAKCECRLFQASWSNCTGLELEIYERNLFLSYADQLHTEQQGHDGGAVGPRQRLRETFNPLPLFSASATSSEIPVRPSSQIGIRMSAG